MPSAAADHYPVDGDADDEGDGDLSREGSPEQTPWAPRRPDVRAAVERALPERPSIRYPWVLFVAISSSSGVQGPTTQVPPESAWGWLRRMRCPAARGRRHRRAPC